MVRYVGGGLVLRYIGGGVADRGQVGREVAAREVVGGEEVVSLERSDDALRLGGS